MSSPSSRHPGIGPHPQPHGGQDQGLKAWPRLAPRLAGGEMTSSTTTARGNTANSSHQALRHDHHAGSATSASPPGEQRSAVTSQTASRPHPLPGSESGTLRKNRYTKGFTHRLLVVIAISHLAGPLPTSRGPGPGLPAQALPRLHRRRCSRQQHRQPRFLDSNASGPWQHDHHEQGAATLHRLLLPGEQPGK